MDAKLLVVIGYAFGDNYINHILAQALRDDKARLLLVVEKCDESEIGEQQTRVKNILDVSEEQVKVRFEGAKAFLKTDGLAEVLRSMIPRSPDAPF